MIGGGLSAPRMETSTKLRGLFAGAMNLALFDFDGTITTSDTFSPFVRLAVEPARMRAGQVLLGPLVLGYRLGLVSAGHTRSAVVRFGFRGASAATVRDRGRRYATEVVPGTLRRSALERIEWHKQQGDDIVVVSGSLDVYLRPWCEARGLRCICTELEECNGRLTGSYRCSDCVGAEKVRRIREQYPLRSYSLIYAYGDTEDDREMLDMAQRRYYRWQEIADWSEVRAVGHPHEIGSRPNPL
jgi:phosphatidylglycerophosphatase C